MDLDEALEYARAQGVSDRQLAAVVKAAGDEVRYRRDNDNVILTHPDVDTDIEVHPDTVAQHERAGWTRKPQPKEK